MSITSICQAIRLGCGFSRLISDYSQEENQQSLEKVDFVTRSLIFALEVNALWYQAGNSSPERIRTLKNLEFFTRFSTLPISWVRMLKSDQRSKIASVENFMGSLIGVGRSFSERQQGVLSCSQLEEANPLDFNSFPEERSDINFTTVHPPAYSLQGPGISLGLNILETTLSANLVSQGAAIAQKRKGPYTDEYQDCDLLKLDTIPFYLHTDPILSKYICVITREPIRHIVADPNRKALYEKEAILRWIKQNHTSPLTRCTLTEADLIPLPALQSLIDSRLALLTKLLIEAKSKEK